MAESVKKIRDDIAKLKETQHHENMSTMTLDVCDRLAKRLEAIEKSLNRKLAQLDNATADARLHSARF